MSRNTRHRQPQAAHALGLEPGRRFGCVRSRTFTLDGYPVVTATSYLPAEIVGGYPITKVGTGPGGVVRRRGAALRSFRDTQAMEWLGQVRAAEESQDWNTAIALVSAHAECYSADFYAHHNHLWHLDLLVRAERFTELADLARVDVHARRRLNAAHRKPE